MSVLPAAVAAAVIHDHKAASTKVAALGEELASLKARCHDLPRRIERVCELLAQEQARIDELAVFAAENGIALPKECAK